MAKSLLSWKWLAICALMAPLPARALDELPAYKMTEIGAELIAANPGLTYSVAKAVNEDGDAAGLAITNEGSRAFLYTAEGGAILLPNPGVAFSSEAVDLTDRLLSGEILIVGSASYGGTMRAAAWVYDTTSRTVADTRDVGTLPGFSNSEFGGVNNDWMAVGFSTNNDFSGSPSMVYDGIADLLTGFDFPARPTDINDLGQVSGGLYRGDLFGNYDVLGAPDSSAFIIALNDFDKATGRAGTGRSDGAGRQITAVVRYDGMTWHEIAANSHLDTGNDINAHGDIVGATGTRSAVRAMLYIDALDNWYFVTSLLAPGYRDRFVTQSEGINDSGQIVGSGSGGALLLTPAGPMPVPPAPESLTAKPHPATAGQPWNAISLAWSDPSDLAAGYYLERRQQGQLGWVEIMSDRIVVSYNDTDVGLGVIYEYRMRSRGVAGFSAYSNIASAKAPDTPVDTEAPAVSISGPGDGDQVSGRVRVGATASDNIGVTYMRIQYDGISAQETICDGTDVETLACTWNTKRLPAGWYTLRAEAYDALLNGASASIRVEVTAGGGGGGGGGCHPKKGC